MQRAINEDFGSRDEGGWLTVSMVCGGGGVVCPPLSLAGLPPPACVAGLGLRQVLYRSLVSSL